MSLEAIEITKAIEVIRSGEPLLLSTDFGWEVAFHAEHGLPKAVQFIDCLKPNEAAYRPLVWFSSEGQQERWLDPIPEIAYDLLDQTDSEIILALTPKNINKLCENDKIRVRIAKNKALQQFINRVKAPIVTLNPLKTIADSFAALDSEILKGVHYVVPLHDQKFIKRPESSIALDSAGRISIID